MTYFYTTEQMRIEYAAYVADGGAMPWAEYRTYNPVVYTATTTERKVA